MKKLSFIFMILCFSSCMTFTRFEETEGFCDWYFGRAGLEGTVRHHSGPERNGYGLLHFRLPELIINTQHGLYYPDGEDDEKFLLEAGIVEWIFPYREFASSKISSQDKMTFFLFNPFYTAPKRIFGLLIRLPVYLIHDVSKIFVTPFAAWHYLYGNGSQKKEEKKEK
ncbi:MAG TPA: hypothetical protein PKK05_28680, partial [Leptospiraceae bacterium]|nr:hypothetical protein [Leptospiraceae bacterium]